MRALFRLVFVNQTQLDGGKARPRVGREKKEGKAQRKKERPKEKRKETGIQSDYSGNQIEEHKNDIRKAKSREQAAFPCGNPLT